MSGVPDRVTALAWPRGLRLAVVLIVVLALGVLGTGFVRARWSGSARLSRPGHGPEATYPEAGWDGHGDMVAVWIQGDGAHSVVLSSQQRPGWGWSAPVALSRGVQLVDQPQIAINPAGAMVAVWVGDRSLETAFRSSVRAAWSAPVAVPGGAAGDWPSVGIDNKGRAVLAWGTALDNGRRNGIHVASLSVATGRWSAPVTLAQSDKLLLWPRVAVNARGDAVVVWLRRLRGSILQPAGLWNEVAAVTKPAGSHPWGPAVDLGVEREPQFQGLHSPEFPGPRAAIAADGRVVAVWQAEHAGYVVPDAAFGRVAGGWQPAATISNQGALMPDVGMDAAGDTTVAWEGTWDGAYGIVIADRSATSHRWTTPALVQRVGSATNYLFPHVAVNAAGSAILAWAGYPAQASARHGPQGDWSRPRNFGSGGGNLRPALDSRGRGLLIWQQPDGHRGININASTYKPPWTL